MMTRKFVSMALLLSLTWPLAGAGEEMAQPQPADAEAKPQPADAEAQPQSADAEAQPQPPKVEAHGDWALQCPESAPCFLMQRVFLEENKEKPLISVVLQFSGKPSRLLIAIRTPLEVMLMPGIEFGVDEVKSNTHPFHHCRSEGCLAIFPISKKLRKNLKLGKQANIGYSLTNGKKYSIPVSLTGITAGLQALEDAAKGAKNSK
ncbi:invasion associated locus B family protein [Candidatus Thiosymbion oneisti]|uniref:invasion associated locus B family protein n=1 Tax=Candidatus Thiosymbion oneisti TaxID=589554 RepID=UPI00159F21C1|nr:invasion associated locus B family protein [Candidatus Thiosymbion oneisti]